ncbi:MAG: PqqD family protein [bacterium]|nr:PqqD family protein [bacterium]
MGWFGRKKHPLAGRDLMTLVPARAIDSRRDDASGVVTVLPPRFSDAILGRFLQPRLPAERRHIRVVLETRGSVLWDGIDGETPVHELVTSFERAFPDDAEDAADRVCKWVYAMYNNGFVRFVGV